MSAEPKMSRELARRFTNETKHKLGEVDQALSASEPRQAEQQARTEVQNRFRHFLDRRKEALFRDTDFTGVMLPGEARPHAEGGPRGVRRVRKYR